MQDQNNMYDISEIPLERLKRLKANIEQQQKQLSADIELVDKEIDRKKDTKMEENNKPKVIISDFHVNWKAIKDKCLTTVSKEGGDKEPSREWKRNILMCQHSPIRGTMISVNIPSIPYANSTHFARHHEGIEKYIATEREDRTGVPREQRSQMNPVMMQMDMNIQALINISEKRLCMCADATTRKYWQAVIDEVRKYDEDIHWACVPQCVRDGGCPEAFGNCHYFESFAEGLTKEELLDMKTRYDKYNEFRDKPKVLVKKEAD